jgi:2-iminobutanoate/2-iminopropanoate deaminase
MRLAIETPQAPAPIGPYSQAIESGGVLFCSGQLGLDPISGNLVSGVEAQTKTALTNLAAVCERAGFKLIHSARCTIYLTNLADFEVVNRVYQGFFKPPYPARTTVQVAALPKGGLVEIDAVVVRTT